MSATLRMARAIVTLVMVLTACRAAGAQPLGTFRWQLQPFCNVVTLAVTQNGGVYRVEGTDDRCGNGADQASAIGTAFPNPDGSIGIGLSIVASPNAIPINVDATITIATLSGTWRDTAGNSGSFTFTPGAGSGGNPRPLPSPPAGGDVTGVIAGTGLTGGGPAGEVTIAVDSAVVQSRVSGACAAGEAVRAVNQNGTVACEPVPAVPAAVQLRSDGSLVANATGVAGPIPASGPGVRLMWYPARAAFRAGSALGTNWDLANLGFGSVAFGHDVSAAGTASFAVGQSAVAEGLVSTAIGYGVRASGTFGIAMGGLATASGQSSVAIGSNTAASGRESIALGTQTRASGEWSTAIGKNTTASGTESTAMGEGTTASGNNSTAMGANTVASGDSSTALGRSTTASGISSLAAGQGASAGGFASVALGVRVSASTSGTFMFGDASSSTNMSTNVPNQFLVRAAGGTGFYSGPALTTGVELLPFANAWSSASDSRIKTAFRDLSHDDVLDKIAQMAVSEWSYIAQDPAIRHIGPTAQDFYAAFGLGEDPLRISTLDADGVALAAVRALEARTRAMGAVMRQQSEAIAALESELAALRAMVRAGAAAR